MNSKEIKQYFVHLYCAVVICRTISSLYDFVDFVSLTSVVLCVGCPFCYSNKDKMALSVVFIHVVVDMIRHSDTVA